MTITWLGHACFRLEQGGYSIIIDPYNSVTGYPDIQTEANAVWCSHGHHDHSYTAGVTLLPAGEDPLMRVPRRQVLPELDPKDFTLDD